MEATFEFNARTLDAAHRLSPPHMPNCKPMELDGASLAESRRYMTSLGPHRETQAAVRAALSQRGDMLKPPGTLAALRGVLDSMRELPRGPARLRRMNTFVRTLGERPNLATLLDAMRAAAYHRDTREHELVRVSLKSTKHSVYGWCGQTKILRSTSGPTRGITTAEPGVQALLGTTPATAWSLSLHIWQANPHARGFAAGGGVVPGTVAEPPHSHPFDFVSMFAVGGIRQSTYAQALEQDEACLRSGRYRATPLTHVHGVWPPHVAQEKSYLQALGRVEIAEGESYFLPCHAIHDVEVDVGEAAQRPAISLFLRSESIVMPHVYMAPEMAEYHKAHPQLEHSGRVLKEDEWHQKLSRVADYVRGTCPTLQLADVVNFDAPYAFFHV